MRVCKNKYTTNISYLPPPFSTISYAVEVKLTLSRTSQGMHKLHRTFETLNGIVQSE